MTLEFLLTTFIIVATPGTGALYTVATGLSGGARTSMVAALGCTLGIVPHMFTVITGLAALLHTSAMSLQIIKYLGAAWLLYMAWKMISNKEALSVNSEAINHSSRQIITSAILINLLNPKLSLFFLAFLPQFIVNNGHSAVTQMLEMSMVFMVMTLLIFSLYGVFAATVRQHVMANVSVQRWVQRAFSGAFAVLAVKLALTPI